MVRVAHVKVAARQPLDLLPQRQPRLRVFDHEAPVTENQPAPYGNGLIMM
jgi:hypothetical protein